VKKCNFTHRVYQCKSVRMFSSWITSEIVPAVPVYIYTCFYLRSNLHATKNDASTKGHRAFHFRALCEILSDVALCRGRLKAAAEATTCLSANKTLLGVTLALSDTTYLRWQRVSKRQRQRSPRVAPEPFVGRLGRNWSRCHRLCAQDLFASLTFIRMDVSP
jgi:hypothetical protein